MARPVRKSTHTTKAFSERLSDLVEERKKQGLSHKQIAAGIGVGAGTLSDWCSDNKTPTIDAVPKIAAYFGVSVEWLFKMSEDRTIRPSIIDELKLSPKAVNTLQNLKDNEKLFLNKLLEDRESFYFIASGYADFIRIRTTSAAIGKGWIAEDFGPDTLEIQNKLDFSRFTLSNRFSKFIEK